MNLAAYLLVLILAFCHLTYQAGCQSHHENYSILPDSDEPSTQSKNGTVFNCTFEDGACNFKLMEPGKGASEDDLRWFRRQAVVLDENATIYDHTKASPTGTLLFANSGHAGSMSRVETSPELPAINCSSPLCCFNAYALMRQSANATGSQGSITFFIIQDTYGADPISTILANLSFTSFGNYWTNVQRTFHANSMPFRLAIEVHNGAGGDKFFMAVDDISIAAGLCPSDKELFGGHPGLCGAPPAVVAGEASVSFGHTLGAGTQVSYSCLLGYDLIGPSTVTCMLDGQWSIPPICSPFRTHQYTPKIEDETNDFSQLPPNVQAEERPAGTMSVASVSSTDCLWGPSLSHDTSTSGLTTLYETKLLLFPDNPITCSGTLLRWVFFNAPVADNTPVYLSIWRPVDDGYSGSYRLIGFNTVTTKKSLSTVQYLIPAPNRFEVREGDIIGIMHKAAAVENSVFMYDTEHLPPGGSSKLFNGVLVDRFIEDLSPNQQLSVTVGSSSKTNVLPLLQVHIGTTECPEQFLDYVTFSGINTIIPQASTDDACWSYCRDQPSCYAVTFDESRGDCRAYSYVSTEVHFSSNHRSMVKLCKADCDTKMLSDGQGFDLAFTGTTMPIGPTLRTAAECELACRYTPTCTSFTYSNPFRLGTCILFSSTPTLRRDPNSRSFRKWGCTNVQKIDNCHECLASFQCQDGSDCVTSGSSSPKSYCIPYGRDIKFCREIASQHPCSAPPLIDFGRVVTWSPIGPAIYACDSGYELSGYHEISCDSSTSQWQLPLPSCRPRCPTIPDIASGIVELLPITTSTRQVTVSCNNGYRLVGDPVISCVSPSRWSSVPRCVADCSIPPGVGNADLVVIEGTEAMPLSVRYDCNAGFKIQGSDTLHCANGVWSPAAPSCQVIPPESTCPPALSLTNGAITDSGIYNNNPAIKFVSYKCLDGYELIGQSTVFCNSGQWDKLPACSAMCGPIPTVANAQTKILSSKNGQPTTVQYECIGGRQIEGDPIVSCISALWSQPPTCVNGTKPNYCGNPPGVVYGTWRSILQLGNWPLSVEYFCSPGYYLVGPTRLTCLRMTSASLWQPAVVPLCQPVGGRRMGLPPTNRQIMHSPISNKTLDQPLFGGFSPSFPSSSSMRGNPVVRIRPNGPPRNQGVGTGVMTGRFPRVGASSTSMTGGGPSVGPTMIPIDSTGSGIPAQTAVIPQISAIPRRPPVQTGNSNVPVMPSGPIGQRRAPNTPLGGVANIGLPAFVGQVIQSSMAVVSNGNNDLSQTMSQGGGNLPLNGRLQPGQSMPYVPTDALPQQNNMFRGQPASGLLRNMAGTSQRRFPVQSGDPALEQNPLVGVLNSGLPLPPGGPLQYGPTGTSSNGLPLPPGGPLQYSPTGTSSNGLPLPPGGPLQHGPPFGASNKQGMPAMPPGNFPPMSPAGSQQPGIPQSSMPSISAGAGASQGRIPMLTRGLPPGPPQQPSYSSGAGGAGLSIPSLRGTRQRTAGQYSGGISRNFPFGFSNRGYGLGQQLPWQLTKVDGTAVRGGRAMAGASPTASSCSMIPVVANARYHVMAGDAMSEVVRIRYVCYDGFASTGPLEIECRENGKWTLPPPQCIPDVGRFRNCGSPPNVANSVIYPLPEIQGQPKIVRYTCKDGFELVGNHTLYCVDGIWHSATNNAEPPICILSLTDSPTTTMQLTTVFMQHKVVPRPDGRRHLHQRHKVIRPLKRSYESHFPAGGCSSPPPVAHAHVWMLKGTVDDPIEIEYHCQLPGYGIVGDSRLRCLNGVWQKVDPWSPPPKCVPGASRKNPLQLALLHEAVNLENESNANSKRELSLCGPEPVVVHAISHRITQHSIMYQCTGSMKLLGSPIVYCSDDGVWTELPYCVHMDSTTKPTATTKTAMTITTSTTTGSVSSTTGSLAEPEDDDSICNSRPPVVRNAVHQVIKGTRRTPKVIRFHCLAGYEPVGAIDVRCYRASWGPPPRCIKATNGGRRNHRRGNSSPTREPPHFFAEEFSSVHQLPYQPSPVLRSYYRRVETASHLTTTTTLKPAEQTFCWKMPQFLNGFFLAVPSPTRNGAVSSIRFVCKPGYVLFGPKTADCLPGEQWSAMPRCDPLPKPADRKCKGVPIVQGAKYGVIEGTNTNPTRIRYICANKRRMLDHGGTAGVLACNTTTGEWYPTPPRCEMEEQSQFAMQTAWPFLIFTTQPPTSPSTTTTTTTTMTTTTTTHRQRTRPPTTTLTPACPPLPVKESGLYHYITGGASATAVLVCNEGYEITKGQLPIVRCSFGKWQPIPVPTCERRGCQRPPNLANADRTILDSVGGRLGLHFRCLPGFQMIGEPNVYCNNGVWSRLPTCRRGSASLVTIPTPRAANPPRSCGPIPQLSNGFFEMTSVGGSMGARFQCLPGYALIGSRTIVCGSDGRWPSTLPSCQVVHPNCVKNVPSVSHAFRIPIPLFDGGYLANTTSEFTVMDKMGRVMSLPAVARYQIKCHPGYLRIGSPVINCSPAGKWTDAPACQVDKSVVIAALIKGNYIGNNCATPPPIVRNGRYRRMKNHPRSLLFYYCKTNYKLSGPPIVFCEKMTGYWTMAPMCIKKEGGMKEKIMEIADALLIACRAPPSVMNAVMSNPIVPRPASLTPSRLSPIPNVLKEESEPIFPTYTKIPVDCIPGFQLVGEPVIQCMPNGNWSRLPKCIGCGSPPFVANAFSEPLVGRGHSLRYRCQSGYTLEGDALVTCRNGFWSQPPLCRKKAAAQCGSPPVVANSQIVETSLGRPFDGPFSDGQWVRYSCIPGFQLVAATTGIPSISRPALLGRVTCSGSQWGSAPSCAHEPPPVVSGCYAGPHAAVRRNGALIEPTTNEMAICPTAHFTCAGYVNNWEIGAMSSATGSTVAFVSVWRRAEVGGGFRLVGSNKVQPRPGIHMYDVQPSEQIRVEVGDFIGIHYADNVASGVIPYQVDAIGSHQCLTAPYTAGRIMSDINRRGYLFMGSAVQPRQYILRGHIDNALPLCPELPPRGGLDDPGMEGIVVSGFGLAPGSKRLVQCKPGYRLKGPAVISCYDGAWKPSLPYCVSLNQPTGTSLETGPPRIEELDPFETLLAKKSYRKLKARPRSRNRKVVKTTTTTALPRIPDYIYSVEDDYTENAILSSADCGPPPNIAHGHTVRRSFETVEYECDPDYMLVGSRQITCISDDEDLEYGESYWPTESLPRCVPLDSLLHSSVSAGVGLDKMAASECSAVPPTHLPHSSPLVLQSPRSAAALLCPQLVINCTGIVDRWVFLSDRDDNASVILSVWRKVGDGRMVVVGANKFRVTHKGQVVKNVSPKDQFKAVRGDFIGVHYEGPTEKPVISLISPMSHRFMEETPGDLLEDSHFDCFSFDKFDREIRQAMRRPGFLATPRNAKAKTVAPPAVGLHLKGPLTCQVPPPLAFGRIHAAGSLANKDVAKQEAAIGQRIVYSCNPGYGFNSSSRHGHAVVSVIVTCLENGQWYPEPPTRCVRNCPQPPVIEHASAKLSYPSTSDPQIGDTVRYDCSPGFMNKGPVGIMCQQNYTWSLPLPNCARTCGEPPQIVHSVIDAINVPGYSNRLTKMATPGDTFSYSCNEGFLLIGRNVITCTESGSWMPPNMPRCLVECEPLPVIENARLLTPSFDVSVDSAVLLETPIFTPGDDVIVECEHGFISTATGFGGADGTKIKCGTDGRWMQPLPQCLSSCGSFPSIENARLQLSTEPTVLADPLIALSGQSAVIECAPGFSLENSIDTITCLYDGTFSSPLPVCSRKPVSCKLDDIPYVENSILLSDNADNGTTVGSHRHVSCLPGYKLEGESEIVCLIDGAWSTPPSCKLVDCGDSPSVLTAVANRLVINSHNGTNGIPQVVYKFSCQYGYELVGNSQVFCQADDQTWSDLPRCIHVGNPLCRLGSAVPTDFLSQMLPMPALYGEPVLADAMYPRHDMANLALCPSMRAVCTGEADRWIFLSQRNDGSIVVFGIWRPISDDRFELVGSTRWTANAVGRQMVVLDESTVIRVQNGDIIGVHYEHEADVPVVPFIDDEGPAKLQSSPYPSCYQLPLNDADISMAMSSVSHVALSSAFSNSPNFEYHVPHWRRPAVQLLVRPARGCSSPSSLVHGSHNFDSSLHELGNRMDMRSPLYVPPGHVVTFACDSGYQLAGKAQISCQSDGTWAPAPPLCVPEVPNCRVGHDWALNPLPESAQLPGRWLTMYPSMRFGCSAEIVEWRVYSLATVPTQVYLDVWRKVTGDWFELVGSNNFTLSTPGLISLSVPTSSRIIVDHDCFIGLHYGQMEQNGSPGGPKSGVIAHWTAQSAATANRTVFATKLQKFISKQIAERDLRSEIVGYHYVSMQHSQQGSRTPAIVALALTLPGCGVPKSIAWGSFNFDRSLIPLSSLPTQPLSSLTVVGQRAFYSCFEHFEMRGTGTVSCTERGWTPAPMCIPRPLCTAGFTPPSEPVFSSSGSYLMLFTSMQFTCDGIVTSWRFYSLAAGQVVYFGVWRPLNVSSGESTYRLVGANTIRTSTANSIESHQIEQLSTVAVRRGDIVGIHYPSVNISADQMVVPFADQLESRPWKHEQLFSGRIKDVDHIAITGANGIVVFSEPERKQWRIPALQAVVTASFIDCGPAPSVSHATLVTGHGTRQSAVHRFACDEGFILVGNADVTCTSDGTWSKVPTCRPIGHCIWNSHETSQKSLPAITGHSQTLAASSDLQQEVSQMVIFTSLPIRCTGLVKEWRFLTTTRSEGIASEPFTVHIDIWRLVPKATTNSIGTFGGLSGNHHQQVMTESHPQEFVLVGTNTLSVLPDDSRLNASVLTYNVPAESQLFAVVGDFVGWHYDAPASPITRANAGPPPVVLVAAADESEDQPSPHEAILAPVFHASLRAGDRHRFASAVRRRLPAPRLEVHVDNSQILPYGLCDGNTRCPSNSDCLRRNCFAPACVCRDGFALNSNNTLCLPAVQLNQRCDKSVACEAFNSRCSERGVCECLSGWEAASDGRRCRPVSPTAGLAFALRGERCDATRQCYHRWYDQTCTEGVCRCRSGFRAATSVERRAFPHSATECRPMDYNLTSSEAWGDEAWSGDGTGLGGCNLAGQSSLAGALFNPYPKMTDEKLSSFQTEKGLIWTLIGLAFVAFVGLSVVALFGFRNRRHRQISS